MINTQQHVLSDPKNIASLVSYQDGSVVSKELLHKGGGTVTLFAFDAGQKLSEHTAPFDALVEVIDGTCEISVDGKPSTLVVGDAILMPANHPHKVVALKQFKMLLTMIRAE